MRSMVRCALIGIVLVLGNGCTQKSAKLQRSVVPPDKTLFERASDYLEKSQYIRSRLAFQTLLNTYPDSEIAPLAYLGWGDSFYEEGGTENLLMAEDQYKNFIVFYPNHPKAPDAQLKVISTNMRLMNSPEHDQQPAYKTLREIDYLLQKWPDSDYAPIAKQWKAEVEEVLALHNLSIGQFYEDRGNYQGASGRYKEVLDDYTNYSERDSVYYRMGVLYEKGKNPDQAAVYYESVVRGYPFSKHYEEAKERLNLLGKPIPAVDKELADLNRSKVKPDKGFSPLKPFIDLGKTLGFVPPVDHYELAKKTVEEEKVKRAEAAGRITGEEPPAGDIQIETIIRKSADGETQDTTTLGGSFGNTPEGDGDEK
jgi:outer membrane assembly lipoprotein YfiO